MKIIKPGGITTALKVLLVISLAFPPAWAQPAAPAFTQVISIGDSLSDTGNVEDISLGLEPAGQYYMGRFSNGPLWNELLAMELGLTPPTPSRNGGNNWAFGGALTSQNVNIVIIPIILVITLPAATQQLLNFLNSVGSAPDNDALYTISIGGNDILETGDALPVGATTTQINTAKQEMYNVAGSLEVALQYLLDQMPGNGEARVVLLTVPNVGATPRASVESKQFIYEELTLAYNQGLKDVNASINDPRLVLVDFFAITNAAIANPASVGLSNVTDRCWQEFDGSICPNPDEYLFWDDIHPTTMGHTLLMLEALKKLVPDFEPVNVPVPPYYAWLLLLLFAMTARRIKRNEDS